MTDRSLPLNLPSQCEKCGEVFHSIIQIDNHVCLPSKDSYYNTTGNELFNPKLSKEEILKTIDKYTSENMKMLASTFKGIPVKVDPELEGNQYYLCISKELLAELEKVKEVGDFTG